MNFAFLYNSDDPSLVGDYCYEFRELMLKAGILQQCNRPMRFGEGDILTLRHAKTYGDYKTLTLKVIQPRSTNMLLEQKVSNLLPNITVATIVFQNMALTTAQALHNTMLQHDCYLGATDVDFADAEHLVMFRNYLPEDGRFSGKSVRLFYPMGELENYEDVCKLDQFGQAGFATSYVDSGARRTIFDDFDTLKHFQRIGEFQSLMVDELHISEPDVSDFCHALEEIHPRLFETLFSAAKALKKAETADEIAQVGLACRRFLKLIVDAWFPGLPKAKFKGRDVTDAHVKNRFWAHLEQNLGLAGAPLGNHGKSFDEVWERASKYLHEEEPERDEVISLLRCIMSQISSVISLDFEAATRPYSAYKASVLSFWEDVEADRKAK